MNIPNPLPYDLDIKKCLNLTSHNVIMVGRGDAYLKGFSLGLEAMNIVYKKIPDVKLLIISPESMRKYIFNLINKLNISQISNFYGNITDVRPYYSISSVMVVPSLTEGYSFSLSEGKCYGLPIVTNGLEFLPLVKGGVSVAKLDDPESMGNEIINLLKNDSYRKRKGKDSFQSLRNFSNDIVMKKWESLFYHLRMDSKVNLNKFFENNYKEYNKDKSKEIILKYFNISKKRLPKFKCLQFENFCDINYIKTLQHCKE